MTSSEERARVSTASAAFITRADHRVLLVHHARSGLWVLPGGKGEHHEPPRATAGREAAEELGVPVSVGRLLAVNWLTEAAELFPGAAQIPHAYPCLMFTFHVEITPENADKITIAEREIHEARWWDVREASTTLGVMEYHNAHNLLTAYENHLAGREATYLEAPQHKVTDDFRGIGVFITNDRGEALMHLRDTKEGIAWPGYWTVIGGHREPQDRSGQDCAVRELREELGLHVDPADLRPFHPEAHPTHSYAHQRLYRLTWNGSVDDLTLGEGQALRLVPLGELGTLHLPPHIADYFRQIQEADAR